MVASLSTVGSDVRLGNVNAQLQWFSWTLEGQHTESWLRLFRCKSISVMVIALATDKARAAKLAADTASVRCLAPNEAPPVWPDAPAETEPPLVEPQ
jgi:hypothetical protein